MFAKPPTTLLLAATLALFVETTSTTTTTPTAAPSFYGTCGGAEASRCDTLHGFCACTNAACTTSRCGCAVGYGCDGLGVSGCLVCTVRPTSTPTAGPTTRSPTTRAPLSDGASYSPSVAPTTAAPTHAPTMPPPTKAPTKAPSTNPAAPSRSPTVASPTAVRAATLRSESPEEVLLGAEWALGLGLTAACLCTCCALGGAGAGLVYLARAEKLARGGVPLLPELPEGATWPLWRRIDARLIAIAAMVRRMVEGARASVAATPAALRRGRTQLEEVDLEQNDEMDGGGELEMQLQLQCAGDDRSSPFFDGSPPPPPLLHEEAESGLPSSSRWMSAPPPPPPTAITPPPSMVSAEGAELLRVREEVGDDLPSQWLGAAPTDDAHALGPPPTIATTPGLPRSEEDAEEDANAGEVGDAAMAVAASAVNPIFSGDVLEAEGAPSPQQQIQQLLLAARRGSPSLSIATEGGGETTAVSRPTLAVVGLGSPAGEEAEVDNDDAEDDDDEDEEDTILAFATLTSPRRRSPRALGAAQARSFSEFHTEERQE